MRTLVLALLVGLTAAGAASATPPGRNGIVLFSQPRCPLWAGRLCSFGDQPCTVDPVTGTSFVPALPSPLAVLSPDGRSVAWTAGSELVVDNRQVAKVDPTLSPLAWSPDGTHIAATAFTQANPAPLESVDVATGAAQSLTIGVFDPAWSPDGSEIAAAVPDGIVAVPSTGGAQRRIVTDTGSGNVGDSAPDWSPDSSALAYTHLNVLQPSTVQLVARDGSARRDVTQGSQPSWSPDGFALAFVHELSDGEGQLWAVQRDGTGAQTLSATPLIRDSRPRWLNEQQTAALKVAGTCDTTAGDGAVVQGGDGVDTVFVTGAGAEVHGNGGDDLVWVGNGTFGGGGPELVDGGAGRDVVELELGRNTVTAGPGDDRVDALFTNLPQRLSGGSGADWIRGGAAKDAIDGGDGADKLYGEGGSDTIHGGAGNDLVADGISRNPVRLFGDAGNDVLRGGRGPDRLDGGPGNDTIEARDGRRDVVLCGPGRDIAIVDRRDAVGRGCERVLRPRS